MQEKIFLSNFLCFMVSIHFVPGRWENIAIIVSVCMYVCLPVCLCDRWHISKTACPNFTCTLPVAWAQSFSDSNAYVVYFWFCQLRHV